MTHIAASRFSGNIVHSSRNASNYVKHNGDLNVIIDKQITFDIDRYRANINTIDMNSKVDSMILRESLLLLETKSKFSLIILIADESLNAGNLFKDKSKRIDEKGMKYK